MNRSPLRSRDAWMPMDWERSALPMSLSSSAPSMARAPCTLGPGSAQMSLPDRASRTRGRLPVQDPAPLTGSSSHLRLAAGLTSRSQKTPERGRRRLVGLVWGLLGLIFVSILRQERAPRGRPCQSNVGRSRELGSAGRPPRLGRSHFLCLWLAIWAAHWLLLPGVGRVCLSVPGRKGRAEFVQTCDAALLAGVMLKALFVSSLLCQAVRLAGQVAAPSQSCAKRA